MRRLLTALALVVGADAASFLYCNDADASNYQAPADRPAKGERASPPLRTSRLDESNGAGDCQPGRRRGRVTGEGAGMSG